jgi:hypothetical protein
MGAIKVLSRLDQQGGEAKDAWIRPCPDDELLLKAIDGLGRISNAARTLCNIYYNMESKRYGASPPLCLLEVLESNTVELAWNRLQSAVDGVSYAHPMEGVGGEAVIVTSVTEAARSALYRVLANNDLPHPTPSDAVEAMFLRRLLDVLEEADDGALGYDMDASPDGESVVRQLMFEVECMLSRLDQQGEGGES